MWYLFRCSHHTSTSVLPSSDGSEIVSLSFRWLHVACFNDWVGGRRGGTVPRVSRFYALNWARPLDCSTASAAAWEERWRWRRDSHCLSDLFVKPRWKQAYRVPWWLTLDRFDLQSASQARCYLICCAVKQGLVTSSPSKQGKNTCFALHLFFNLFKHRMSTSTVTSRVLHQLFRCYRFTCASHLNFMISGCTEFVQKQTWENLQRDCTRNKLPKEKSHLGNSDFFEPRPQSQSFLLFYWSIKENQCDFENWHYCPDISMWQQ